MRARGREKTGQPERRATAQKRSEMKCNVRPGAHTSNERPAGPRESQGRLADRSRAMQGVRSSAFDRAFRTPVDLGRARAQSALPRAPLHVARSRFDTPLLLLRRRIKYFPAASTARNTHASTSSAAGSRPRRQSRPRGWSTPSRALPVSAAKGRASSRSGGGRGWGWAGVSEEGGREEEGGEGRERERAHHVHDLERRGN